MSIVIALLGAAAAASPVSQTAPADRAPIPRALFDDWLRHDGVVVDVEWGPGESLVTVDASGRVTRWDMRSRARVVGAEFEGCTDVAVHAGGDRPAGIAIAHGREGRRVDWRPDLAVEPLWVAEGLGAPLALDGSGATLAGLGGEFGALVVELVGTGDGARRPAVELIDWELRGLAFADGELGVLGFNRNKSLGRKGTEEEPWASLWRIDVASGTELARVDLDAQPSQLLRFGEEWLCLEPDGRAWAVGAAPRGPIDLSPGTGAALQTSVVGPDGSLVQLDVRGQLVTRTALDGEPEARARVGVGSQVLCPAPDGAIVAASIGTSVQLVTDALSSVGGAQGFSSQVSTLRFDADAARLLGASYDHSVRVFDPAGGAELALYRTVGIVHAAAWLDATPEAGRVAWVARGGALEQRALAAEADQPRGAVAQGAPWTDLAGASGELVAVISGGAVQAVTGAGLTPLWAGQGPRGTIQRIALTPGRALVASSGLVVLDRESGAKVGELGDMGAPVQSLAAAAAAPRAVVGLASGAVGLVDVEQVSVLATVAQHRGRVQAVALSADGRLLASVGTNDGSITLTRLAEDGAVESALELPWPGPGCSALAFTPDGRALAAGGRDGDVRIFELVD